MLLGWIRPDRWRRIDAVIDYFGSPRVARIRRASPTNGASLAAGGRAAKSRPLHIPSLLRTALLVHSARS
jgi:hypothetical protein